MGSIRLLLRYLKFLIRSQTKYDIHSPFIYNFITEVIEDARHFYAFDEIEFCRDLLLQDRTKINVDDKGAGSKTMKSTGRKVSDIAATSLTNRKFGELLFRIVNYYKLNRMLELGTSLGISALYLAKANPNASLVTIEGSSTIAKQAESLFNKNKQTNVKLVVDEFSHALANLNKENVVFDLIYIDGNHQKHPTLEYFDYLKTHHATHTTIFIFDDIHWSRGMEEAWTAIQKNDAVTCTIDLFYKGIVFLNPTFHSKQHFTIKY